MPENTEVKSTGIKGIGTDLVKTARLEKIWARNGQAFAKKILTTKELEQLAATSYPARFLAKRFAAKEAALKALGTGLAQGISWQHLEITNDELGKPLLALSEAALARATALGATSWHLSLSDEEDYALAFVVLSA